MCDGALNIQLSGALESWTVMTRLFAIETRRDRLTGIQSGTIHPWYELPNRNLHMPNFFFFQWTPINCLGKIYTVNMPGRKKKSSLMFVGFMSVSKPMQYKPTSMIGEVAKLLAQNRNSV